MGCSLPEADLLDDHLTLQAATFALLFEQEKPAIESDIAQRAGLDLDTTNTRLAEIERKGMLRRDEQHRIVGIAGLTIVPTQHKIDIGDTTRWTWCALDAVGIIGAMGRGGAFTTTVPGTGQRATVNFNEGGETDSSAVVFIADGFADGRVVDDWCPTVNLFPDTRAASAWAEANDVTGRSVSIPDLMPDATAMWAFVAKVM